MMMLDYKGWGVKNLGKIDYVICEHSPNILSQMMVMGKYRPEKTPYLDTFYAVLLVKVACSFTPRYGFPPEQESVKEPNPAHLLLP